VVDEGSDVIAGLAGLPGTLASIRSTPCGGGWIPPESSVSWLWRWLFSAGAVTAGLLGTARL